MLTQIPHPIAEFHTASISGENAMGGACGAYGGEERRIQGIGGET